MRKFIVSVIGAMCTMSVAKGLLLWLANKNIFPEKWIAAMIGLTESAFAESAIIWIIMGIAGLIGIVIALPLFEWSKNKFTRAKQQTVIMDQDIYPDITINDLFDYINDNTHHTSKNTNANDDDPLSEIAQAVKDKISVDRLIMWGREYIGGIDGYFEPNSLKKIKLDDWDNFTFTLNFGYEGPINEATEDTKSIDAINRGYYKKSLYRDVQFNRAQMQSIWPKK